MEFSELQKKALEVRAKYAQYEIEQYGEEWNISDIASGFVGDVGDLVKLIMGKIGKRSIENVDEKLAHELADCLWCVLVLADKLQIDLEGEFLKTMKELDERIS